MQENTEIRLRITNTGVRIDTKYLPYIDATRDFCKTLTTYEERFDYKTKRKIMDVKDMYAIEHATTGHFYIHRGHLNGYYSFMKERGLNDSSITAEYVEAKEGDRGYLRIAKGVEPREEQKPIIDFVLRDEPVRVLPIQTGRGKTFMSLYAIAKHNKRAMVTMLPREIDTWIKDASWIFENSKYEILVIQGMKAFAKMIDDRKRNKLKESIILMSSMTLQSYIKEFIKTGETSLGVNPDELYEFLGVDIKITDEAHERLHFNFIHDMLTNVDRSIYLSATIESNQPFKNRLYGVIFPLRDRYSGLAWHRYIHATAIGFHLQDDKTVVYNGPRGSYSHDVFEGWIRKKPDRLRRYMDLISRVVEVGFHNRYQPNMKMLIFCYTTEMCKIVADDISNRYHQYSCSAFNMEHEDDVLHNHDIVVTTIKSAGTGKDIKGLVTTLNTVAIDSREANIQILGRLRDLNGKFGDEEPVFYYFVCKDIPTHIRYHKRKLHTFQGLVKSHNAVTASIRV